jgi:hypothetical protein
MAMADHIRIAAVLRLIYSALGILLAIVILPLFGGLAVAIAAVAGDPGAALAGGVTLATIASLMLGLAALSSLPGLLAAWGMLRFRAWGRILGIVLAFLDLFTFPVGTALGAYSLWVLFHPESAEIFEYGGPIRF